MRSTARQAITLGLSLAIAFGTVPTQALAEATEDVLAVLTEEGFGCEQDSAGYDVDNDVALDSESQLVEELLAEADAAHEEVLDTDSAEETVAAQIDGATLDAEGESSGLPTEEDLSVEQEGNAGNVTSLDIAVVAKTQEHRLPA